MLNLSKFSVRLQYLSTIDVVMFNVYPRKLNTCEASGFIFSWYYSIQRLKMFSVSCCKSLHSQMVGCDPKNALDLFWSREKAKCKQFSELGMSKIMVMVFILLIIKQYFLELLLLCEYLSLCSAEQRHSYRFGTTWGWVNDDRIFIFGWTIPLNCLLFLKKKSFRSHNFFGFT